MREDLKLILYRLDEIEKKIDSLKRRHEKDYVSITDYKVLENEVGLLKKIVFTSVGLVLVGFLGALMSYAIPNKRIKTTSKIMIKKDWAIIDNGRKRKTKVKYNISKII